MSESYHFDDEVRQRAYDARLMRRLLTYLRPYKAWIGVAVLLLLAASLLSSLVPLLNMYAIDWYIHNPERTALERRMDAVEPIPTRLESLRQHDVHNLEVLLLLILAVMGCRTLARFAESLIVAFVGQKTLFTMRLELFEHLQHMSLRFLDKNPVGRLMTRVTNDIEKIQETIVSGLVQVAGDFVTIVIVLFFMFWVNWVLAVLTLSTVPFVFLAGLLFRIHARKSYLEIRKRLAGLNAYMQECVSGMRVVQLFGQEERSFEEYSDRNARHRDEWIRQIRNYALYFPTIDFLGYLSLGLIVLYIGYRLLGRDFVGATGASIGTLFAYVQWAERLYAPIRTVADRYNMLLEAMASSERIFALLDTAPEIQDKPDPIPCNRIRGLVEFRDVWFAYEENQWVLKGTSFRIEPGEQVAIVGLTGAGKTTLASLLNRFYDVQRGAILIDGIDVRDYEQESLRRSIGMVLQDVFLFSGSIEENIRLGNPELSEEAVRACAEYVNAASFVAKLPGGYAYDVGERGCNLSTGQRQLVAFARALAHDPKILLLDEATSSVDPATEALIQDAIAKLLAGRTSIVIAHRLSTIHHADRIIVLHHGELREMGTHQELLARGGLYSTLYQLQYKNQRV